MPKRGKRLKFRAHDACSGRVTVADYANSDPAIVRSGRVKKAVANAVQQEVKSLCGLEASQVPAEEALSGMDEPCDIIESSDEMDAQEEGIRERTVSRKKKSKRHKEDLNGAEGEEYPIDIWLLLASYIRPEDIVNFSLICKNAWTVTCTAAFWTRLYRRHYTLDASLPLRLRPESMEKLRCLRACVIRSLYHMYEPFAARISKNPAIPESTPSTLKNSKCLLFWCRKIVGNRQEPMWEFNFKFKKQSPRLKSKCMERLQPPIQYEDVHTNPDQDCCLLQVTTLNFIFIPIVMGMIFTLFTINVSTDMRHHRVRLVFQDSPVRGGRSLRNEQGVQVILDPVHSVRLFDWWHPQPPASEAAATSACARLPAAVPVARGWGLLLDAPELSRPPPGLQQGWQIAIVISKGRQVSIHLKKNFHGVVKASSCSDHTALQKPWVLLDSSGTLPDSGAQPKTRAASCLPCLPCLSWPHLDAARLFGDTGHQAPSPRG